MHRLTFRSTVACLFTALLAASCGGGGGGVAPSYTIGGTVAGLTTGNDCGGDPLISSQVSHSAARRSSKP